LISFASSICSFIPLLVGFIGLRILHHLRRLLGIFLLLVPLEELVIGFSPRETISFPSEQVGVQERLISWIRFETRKCHRFVDLEICSKCRLLDQQIRKFSPFTS